MQGIILRGIGGFFYAMDDQGEVHTLRAQNKLRRERMKPLVGDRVEMEPGAGEEDGWVLAVHPRKNQLVRPPVANVDKVLVVAAAASPDPDLAMIDRLLVNIRLAGIQPLLAVTKADLNPENAREICRQYARAGVSPIAVCAPEGRGIPELRQALQGSVHALAGQSGAGKSSLINALYGLELETGDLSRKIERGKNTTRRCELIPVSGGGMVLDTPGFSLLDTPLMEPEKLKELYPEFAPYEGKCFFSPCLHAHEPKCAARDAVAEGEIDARRHGRYVEFLEETKKRWKERYG